MPYLKTKADQEQEELINMVNETMLTDNREQGNKDETEKTNEDNKDDVWVATHTMKHTTTSSLSNVSRMNATPDIPDIMSEDAQHTKTRENEYGVEEDDDPAALYPSHSTTNTQHAAQENILKTRTYDMYITYDKYYRTPRLWLSGYNEDRVPLNSMEILQDISQDHARKTVTVEPWPWSNSASNEDVNGVRATVHPCRHAEVMRAIMKRRLERIHAQKLIKKKETSSDEAEGKQSPNQDDGDDDKEGVRVEEYLVVFLKWMSAVLPTIDYDYTMDIEG